MPTTDFTFDAVFQVVVFLVNALFPFLLIGAGMTFGVTILTWIVREVKNIL